MNCILFNTPIGVLALAEAAGCITNVYLPGQPMPPAGVESALLLAGKRQLLEYFSGQRRVFDLPLNAQGTPFRRLVWQHLLTIPYGQTLSYGALAQQLGKPNAGQAVGQANHHNPISIIIPCHRVIGAGGSLTGYGGGLALKRALLQLEGVPGSF